jgi:putative LysE/RhtB family amino acid efflux pump
VHSGAVGFGLGFFVALQIGPMSLFLIRTTLRAGFRAGAAVGAGIAVVDGLYAAAGAVGVAPLLTTAPLRLALGLAGAAVLIALGLRTLHSALRVRLGGETVSEIDTPRRAFLTSMAGTASNPLTIASWAAVFAAASTAGAARTTGAAVLLIAGVATGSLTCVSTLAGGVALARPALGESVVRVANLLAALGMVAFGGKLLYATAHEH